MDCPRIREMFSDYLDGQLGPSDRTVVEEHLRTCLRCPAELKELERTVARLKGLDDVDAPAWLTQRVMARIRGEQPRRSLLQRLFLPLHVKVPLQAAAMALIAVVTLYIFRTMQHEVAPKGTPVPEIQTAVPEKLKEKVEGVTQGTTAEPPRRRTPPLPAVGPREEAGPRTGTPAVPGQDRQAETPETIRKEQPPDSAATPARRDDNAVREQKAFTAQPGGAVPPAPAQRQRAERMTGESAPAPSAAARRKEGKVLWSDDTITADDMGKVTKVVLVQEKKDELVLDVSYYLSPAFDGRAAVGVYPDIPDWAVAEGRALPGRHTVSISISRTRAGGPADSTSLRIEISGYRDNVSVGPLYRRVVLFGKHWEGR